MSIAAWHDQIRQTLLSRDEMLQHCNERAASDQSTALFRQYCCIKAAMERGDLAIDPPLIALMWTTRESPTPPHFAWRVLADRRSATTAPKPACIVPSAWPEVPVEQWPAIWQLHAQVKGEPKVRALRYRL